MKKLVLALATAALFLGCASTASVNNFHKVDTAAGELESISNDMNDDTIPSAVGVGQSDDLAVARSMSQADGRQKIAQSVHAHAKGLVDAYAKNVTNKAKNLQEEKLNQLTIANLHGTMLYKSITEQDDAGNYRVSSLMVMNPRIFKKMMEEAAAGENEMELRINSADMQRRMDDAVRVYQEKYGKSVN